jgi:uncharacterized protein (TIGR01777 family)
MVFVFSCSSLRVTGGIFLILTSPKFISFMETVLITGGTGLIGKALTRFLTEKGYKIIIFSRKPAENRKNVSENVSYASWDIKAQTFDRRAIEQADHIIHLAGAGVADKRWSESRKQEILDSRVQGSALLVKAIKETPNKIKTVVSASGIGWYGADPAIPNPKPFVETDEPDKDFLGETCRLWEESIHPVIYFGKRLVKLRTGIVLSREGGAFAEFRKPVKFGVAGIIGSGKQVISWIHIDDICRMYLYALENKSVHGIYNAVAPKPVSNRELTLCLAREQKGPFFVPVHVPTFALKLALGELSVEILKSTTVSSDKIRKSGFDFMYNSIEPAVKALVK